MQYLLCLLLPTNTTTPPLILLLLLLPFLQHFLLAYNDIFFTSYLLKLHAAKYVKMVNLFNSFTRVQCGCCLSSGISVISLSLIYMKKVGKIKLFIAWRKLRHFTIRQFSLYSYITYSLSSTYAFRSMHLSLCI